MAILKNIKFAFRTLSKNKGASMLNLVGLTIGMTASMLIFLFVMKERKTDKYIPDLNQVYVLTNNGACHYSQSMVNHIKTEVPEMEVITYCTVDWSPQIFLKKNNQSYKIEHMLTADSSFFRVFNFKTVWGNTQDALNAANKIVITRSLSEKIFGTENAVGKTLTYNATDIPNQELVVTAVIDDLPQSSSWEFEAVLSMQTNYCNDWYVHTIKGWGNKNYCAFAKISAEVSTEAVTQKLSHIDLEPVPQNYKKDTKYGIFPFKDAFFDMPDIWCIHHGNRFTLSVIETIAVLIVLLSCVNYINMVTAQREKRYKIMGLFKTMGGSRRALLQMSATESALVLLAALVISYMASLLLLPGFNLLTHSKFTLQALFSWEYLCLLFTIAGILLLFTGIVPGIIFSKKPVTLLIHKNQSIKGKNHIRNSLLIFQFTVSIALIASVWAIGKQNSYLQNHDAGFARENIVFAYTNDDVSDHIDAFKNELSQIAGISNFTFSASELIHNDQNWGLKLNNKGKKCDIHFSQLSVAPNFFDFFGIPLIEGKKFNEHSQNTYDVIINQSAKADFKIDALGDAAFNFGDPALGHIIGVVNDYHFETFHVPVRPAAFMSSGECDNVLYLKVNTPNTTSFRSTMKDVNQLWKGISPHFPFEYHVLNNEYTALYEKEARFQKFLLVTALVSIVLSCLGLVGLTFFVMEQRTKEIGIRKVNGAKISEILAMLNKNFVKWVAIAFTIAVPIAWYALHQWLENFAYKTSLSWWIFALAGVLALGIALLTVSFQSYKAAVKNPVESLRYE